MSAHRNYEYTCKNLNNLKLLNVNINIIAIVKCPSVCPSVDNDVDSDVDE